MLYHYCHPRLTTTTTVIALAPCRLRAYAAAIRHCHCHCYYVASPYGVTTFHASLAMPPAYDTPATAFAAALFADDYFLR